MAEQDADRERCRLAELYAPMADGELQKLARDYPSLSVEGQESLEAGFRRRGLVPEVDLRSPNVGLDVLEWSELILLRQFRDLPDALLAKGSLESSGIEAILVDDNTVRMDWFISNLVGGIKLCVREQDEAAALHLLEQRLPRASTSRVLVCSSSLRARNAVRWTSRLRRSTVQSPTAARGWESRFR